MMHILQTIEWITLKEVHWSITRRCGHLWVRQVKCLMLPPLVMGKGGHSLFSIPLVPDGFYPYWPLFSSENKTLINKL